MNSEGTNIYGTRPWKIYAEGPTVARGMKRNNKGEEKEQSSFQVGRLASMRLL